MGTQQKIDWEAVTEVAIKIGASPEATRKWRERGAVPGKWQLSIVAASKGKIPAKAFLPALSPSREDAA